KGAVVNLWSHGVIRSHRKNAAVDDTGLNFNWSTSPVKIYLVSSSFAIFAMTSRISLDSIIRIIIVNHGTLAASIAISVLFSGLVAYGLECSPNHN
ncbi:hypothetical protein, partial [Weissella cibaria]|uniref:hypothetical protein n=1 Tax=Weissella cibaria TaxID=137591 RepID=UPI0019D6553F